LDVGFFFCLEQSAFSPFSQYGGCKPQG